jgi:hypothetical protein
MFSPILFYHSCSLLLLMSSFTQSFLRATSARVTFTHHSFRYVITCPYQANLLRLISLKLPLICPSSIHSCHVLCLFNNSSAIFSTWRVCGQITCIVGLPSHAGCAGAPMVGTFGSNYRPLLDRFAPQHEHEHDQVRHHSHLEIRRHFKYYAKENTP